MSWTLIITEHFKRAIEDRKDLWVRIDVAIGELRKDPFAQHLPIKPVKSRKGTYRYRIGGFRLLFAIDKDSQSIFLMTFAKRDDVYEEDQGRRAGRALGQDESVAAHVEEPARQQEIVVEDEALVSEDELDVLSIPEEYLVPLLELKSVNELEAAKVPEWVRLRVMDWLTSSSPSDVARLYCLAPDDSAQSIAARPLRGFLLSLDRQQRAILTIAKHRGPVLVRGGPGTGKSLLGLYRLNDFIQTRQAESLLDSEPASYAFITYTNTLVRANEKLFESLRPRNGDGYTTRFSTLDAIALEIVREGARQGGRSVPQFLTSEATAEYIRTARDAAVAKSDDEARRWIERMSLPFVEDEVELVIEGRDLDSLEDYLALERVGRGTPLMPQQRRVVWSIYQEYRGLCEKANQCSWGRLRKLALNELKGGKSPFKLFDGVFVDEIQDLNVVGIRLCAALCKRVQFAMFAVDSGQSIYNVAPTWRGVHVDLVFGGHNSLPLTRNYRMTKQLVAALAPWRSEIGDGARDQAGSGTPVFTGPPPKLITAPMGHHAQRTASIIQAIVEKTGINPNQIAVVVRTIHSSEARDLRAQLMKSGVACQFFDKKSGIELDKPTVNIITAHSAKGLEFPMVVVPFVSANTYPLERAIRTAEDAEKENALQQERRLLYVAASRASYMLWMLADATLPSPFLKDIATAHWDLGV